MSFIPLLLPKKKPLILKLLLLKRSQKIQHKLIRCVACVLCVILCYISYKNKTWYILVIYKFFIKISINKKTIINALRRQMKIWFRHRYCIGGIFVWLRNFRIHLWSLDFYFIFLFYSYIGSLAVIRTYWRLPIGNIQNCDNHSHYPSHSYLLFEA